MNYIIICLLSILAINVSSQNTSLLTNNEWEIVEHYAEPVGSTDRINYYAKGAMDNIIDFDGFEYSFEIDGIVTISRNNVTEDKTWLFYNGGNSLRLDDVDFEFVSLSNNEFVLRNEFKRYGIDYYSVIVMNFVSSTISCPPFLLISDTTPFSTLYQSGAVIETTGNVVVNASESVTYNSLEILLNADFEVMPEGEFEIVLGGCN